MLQAQIDQVAELMKVSANRGWEATMIAFFCIVVVGLLFWLIRSWLSDAHLREERMAKRLDTLENFQRNTLLEALQDNSRALQELTATLSSRTCLLTHDSGESPLLGAVKRRQNAKPKED